MFIHEIRKAAGPFHERLESRLSIIDRASDLDEYVRILERFFGFYAPLEKALSARTEWREWDFPIEPRSKLHLLLRDLSAFGRTPEEIDGLPLCPAEELPEIETFGQALGCLYAIESATLGGEPLTRHFAKAFDMTAECGLAFFSSYGDEVEGMWKSFTAFLNRYADQRPEELADLIDGACTSFACIENWLCGPSVGHRA